ncbi:MAG TPA: lanthionine synthetase C family protein [Candidatus Angelobacter sp.]
MFISTLAKPHPWEPLLGTDQSQAALASVKEIAGVLTAQLEGQRGFSERKPFLGEGDAGIAIFFAYWHASGFSAEQDLALKYLNRSTNALAEQPMEPSLFAGFAGIAWAAQHISGLLASPGDLGEDILLALETYLNRSPWQDDYDLINGLAGFGVYCLECSSFSTAAVRCLELIVERLEELVEHCDDGLRWFTAPDVLPAPQRTIYPHGYYNLGLAHGMPGIIALLGRIYCAGIAHKKARRLLEDTVDWLLRQQLSEAASSSFPAFLVPGSKPQTCRLAWCYGDAGVAAALLVAARCTGMEPLETAALNIARRAAARDLQSCGVIDACFCHGSSGLAHIFNRIYHATREEVFARAAHFWIQRTLQFRTPNTSAAGYSVMAANPAGTMEFQQKFGLIEGIAGIGLSLLAATSNIEPQWDRMFMVNIPAMIQPYPTDQP